MKQYKHLPLQLIAALLILLLAACGPAPNDPTVNDVDSDHEETEETEGFTDHETSTSGATTTASGLQYIEIEAGTGRQPHPGDPVTVHYIGKLEDGTEFDNSYTRGQPIPFTLGHGEVIPGWDEGVGLMHEGGKAQLIIPPALAYGEAGAGGVIPPNATLIFEVELITVSEPPPTPPPPPPPTSIDDADFTTTDSGLKYAVMQAGSGDLPGEEDMVSIHFSGWLSDGTSLGNSYEVGQPIVFQLGKEEIMAGWDEAVALMQVGEITQFMVPPELGFGEAGSGGIIPPNETLTFELELLDIQDPPPPPTEVDDAEFTETESGLRHAVLVAGDGAMPEIGQTVVVHYRGWLENGVQFDASYDRGEPFEFPLGTGSVIPGWDEGVSLMQVGEKAQFIIPSDIAYGETGGGPIPPGATLIFEVELLEIKE